MSQAKRRLAQGEGKWQATPLGVKLTLPGGVAIDARRAADSQDAQPTLGLADRATEMR